MRDLILNITIRTEILGEKEDIEILISVKKDLLEDDNSIASYIYDYMENYMQDNYCSCSFNESQNHCDCDCGDWTGEYDIIEIESEKGGELLKEGF